MHDHLGVELKLVCGMPDKSYRKYAKGIREKRSF